MTVLTIELANWLVQSNSGTLRPLGVAMDAVKRALNSDSSYGHLKDWFPLSIPTYVYFKDPHHMTLITALLETTNQHLSSPLVNSEAIYKVVEEIPDTPSPAILDSVLNEHPPGETGLEQGDGGFFDFPRCHKLKTSRTQNSLLAQSSRHSSRRVPSQKATHLSKKGATTKDPALSIPRQAFVKEVDTASAREKRGKLYVYSA